MSDLSLLITDSIQKHFSEIAKVPAPMCQCGCCKTSYSFLITPFILNDFEIIVFWLLFLNILEKWLATNFLDEEEEEELNIFECAGCKRMIPWCYGQADKYYDYCDYCASVLYNALGD